MRGSGDEINKRNRGVLPMEQMEKFVVRHIMFNKLKMLPSDSKWKTI